MLDMDLKEKIVENIKRTIRIKLSKYKPESKSMPFHYRLIGKDKMALFSFIHSLNTTFGTSIFEPVAELIASSRFKNVKRQFKVGEKINPEALKEIQNIVTELTTTGTPNKIKEIERLKRALKVGKKQVSIKSVKADLYFEDFQGKVFLIDIKTPKPNITEFKSYKRTLLEWTATFLYNNPDLDVSTMIAIPYNPYEPQPYERWTLKGMLDLENELLVAEEFWDFLGGKGTYSELLECFEIAGIELREEIDEYFSKFK